MSADTKDGQNATGQTIGGVPRSELWISFLRSCEEETPNPLQGDVKGHIPEWLEGTLIRVGSGLLHVGPDHYNHVFDGLALLHRFSVKDGRVTYQNRFLRSDAYKKNMAANRIVVNEFGTRASPDPCQTIFQKISSYFSIPEFTDNDLVNVVQYTDELYACSETNFIWKIDKDTLDALEKVSLTDFVSVRTATAHTHEGRDGTVYNVGFTLGSPPGYSIIKFPPKENSSSNAFACGSVVCRIPATRRFYPSYFHSFGMSDKYFVFLEQPLSLSVPRTLFAHFTGGSFGSSLQWYPEQKCRFFIVRRDNGLILSQQFLAEPTMTFHHINAYEEDDQLVVDLCCYDDGNVVNTLYVETLKTYADDPKRLKPFLVSKAKRYVFPLTSDNKTGETENLVRIKDCKAKAFLKEGTIFCEPEILAEKDMWYTELPRINYDYNGKKYNYFYAIARKEGDDDNNYLVKMNVQNGTTLSWGEPGTIPSEPVYVANKDSDEEDGGVLIASLLSKTDIKKVSLVVINAKTMTELGRAEFVTQSAVPGDFHGVFLGNKSQ